MRERPELLRKSYHVLLIVICLFTVHVNYLWIAPPPPTSLLSEYYFKAIKMPGRTKSLHKFIEKMDKTLAPCLLVSSRSVLSQTTPVT